MDAGGGEVQGHPWLYSEWPIEGARGDPASKKGKKKKRLFPPSLTSKLNAKRIFDTCTKKKKKISCVYFFF